MGVSCGSVPWPGLCLRLLQPCSRATAGVLQQTPVQPSDLGARGAGAPVVSGSKPPPPPWRSHSQISPPPPFRAADDHPGSLAADHLVSDSQCLLPCPPVSQPLPRPNRTFVKQVISKLPTSQELGRRGRQFPPRGLRHHCLLGALSPHPGWQGQVQVSQSHSPSPRVSESGPQSQHLLSENPQRLLSLAACRAVEAQWKC